MSDLQLAIYDDEELFWDYVMRNDSCDCRCKVSPEHTKIVYNVSSMASSDLSIPFTFSFDIHEHLRPRFWYALAHAHAAL